MIWEITYRKQGEMKLRFAQVSGKDENEARIHFHNSYLQCFIKTICKSEKKTKI